MWQDVCALNCRPQNTYFIKRISGVLDDQTDRWFTVFPWNKGLHIYSPVPIGIHWLNWAKSSSLICKFTRLGFVTFFLWPSWLGWPQVTLLIPLHRVVSSNLCFGHIVNKSTVPGIFSEKKPARFRITSCSVTLLDAKPDFKLIPRLSRCVDRSRLQDKSVTTNSPVPVPQLLIKWKEQDMKTRRHFSSSHSSDEDENFTYLVCKIQKVGNWNGHLASVSMIYRKRSGISLTTKHQKWPNILRSLQFCFSSRHNSDNYNYSCSEEVARYQQFRYILLHLNGLIPVRST